jgi:hypothetical protein
VDRRLLRLTIQLAALIHGEAVELTSDDDEGGDSSEVEKAVGETEELEDEFEARNESAAAVILSLVGYSNSNASMVKPTQDWQGEHASYPLGVARNRRILLQRKVCAALVVQLSNLTHIIPNLGNFSILGILGMATRCGSTKRWSRMA